MDILIKIAQFVLSLSILIIAHEMGHYFVARLFKIRVEKFYLFFDWKFSLFKFKRGDTEYGVGWIPLGGYVKIAGMIDESMDTEQMKHPPQPWEFRTKPAWQRLMVMLAGVVVNFILALFIYSMIMFTWGRDYVAVKDAAYGYQFCQTALDNGFRDGDKFVSVDGRSYQTLADVTNAILIDQAKTVTVERDSQLVTITLPSNFADMWIKEHRPFAAANLPAVIDQPTSGSPADKAGIKAGDRIIAVGDTPTPLLQNFIRTLRSHSGETVNLTVEREGLQQTIAVAVSADSTIGVKLQTKETLLLNATHIDYGFFASFPAGINHGIDKLVSYVKSLKFLFRENGYQQLGGFISIGNIFPSRWIWQAFWEMTAFLSIILAFMNILPIPALDGGHVILTLYEMITRHKPSEKFLERTQMVGLVLLIALMVLANGNDLIRLFDKWF